jgi:hypothetical protein
MVSSNDRRLSQTGPEHGSYPNIHGVLLNRKMALLQSQLNVEIRSLRDPV